MKFAINKRNSIAKERVINSITFNYYGGLTPSFLLTFSTITIFITFFYESKQHQWIFFITIASMCSEDNQMNYLWDRSPLQLIGE